MLFRHLPAAFIAVASICCQSVLADESRHSGQSQNLPRADASAVRVAVPANVDVVTSNLNFPTSLEIDHEGDVWIGRSGAGRGDPGVKPAVLKIARDGKTETLIEKGLETRKGGVWETSAS